MHLLPELASHHAVSIPELLVSRDERQARQHVWLKRHPVPLVSFTVVAPGPIKDSEVTRRIFNHGVTALRALAAKQGWQTPEGEILSRRDYSLPPRSCLLCEQSAAVCARGKTHQLTDLLNRMEALLNDVDACNVN